MPFWMAVISALSTIILVKQMGWSVHSATAAPGLPPFVTSMAISG